MKGFSDTQEHLIRNPGFYDVVQSDRMQRNWFSHSLHVLPHWAALMAHSTCCEVGREEYKPRQQGRFQA